MRGKHPLKDVAAPPQRAAALAAEVGFELVQGWKEEIVAQQSLAAITQPRPRYP